MRFPSCVGIPPESELPFINLLVFWILIYFWNNRKNSDVFLYRTIKFAKFPNSVGIGPENWFPGRYLIVILLIQFIKQNDNGWQKIRSKLFSVSYSICKFDNIPSWVGSVPESWSPLVYLLWLIWSSFILKIIVKKLNYNDFKFIKFPNSVGIGPVSGFRPKPLF